MEKIHANILSPEEHAKARGEALAPGATKEDLENFLASMKPRLEWQADAALTQLAQAFLAVGPPPERIRDMAESDAYLNTDFKVSQFHSTLWRYRLPLLAKERGWDVGGMEHRYFSDSVYAVDLGDYTPAASDEGNSYVYCPQDDYVVETCFFASSSYYQVIIHAGPNCTIAPKEIFKELHGAMTKPNPYEGRVVALRPKGEVDLVDLSVEHLSPYGEEVERSVSWLLSIFDDAVAERLASKGLSRKNGLLLEGAPGSGKTTLVRRIAKEGMGDITTIYVAPGTSIKGAMDFAKEFSKSLVVLEDVESHFGERGEEEFTDFLNAIDGVENNQVMGIIATTNDSSGFDPAVVRPGRLEERATINAIHPSAVHSMVASRFDESDETIQRLIAVLTERAEEDGGGYLTPAIIDGLARRAIIMNLSGDALISYAEDDWVLSTSGESHLPGKDEEDEDDGWDDDSDPTGGFLEEVLRSRG